jgi:hypothetical protein
MVLQNIAGPSLIAASPGFALRSARLAPLLALSLGLRSLSRIACRAGVTSGWARRDVENTLTTTNVDGNPLPLSPLANLRGPARVVALGRAGDLRRLALAQEIEDSVPIDVAIFFRNV